MKEHELHLFYFKYRQIYATKLLSLTLPYLMEDFCTFNLEINIKVIVRWCHYLEKHIIINPSY